VSLIPSLKVVVLIIGIEPHSWKSVWEEVKWRLEKNEESEVRLRKESSNV